jgi:hypothetical protein
MNVLFWEDVHTLCQYYRPLFLALLEALTRCEEDSRIAADDALAGGEDAVYCDLLKLAARFICYYDLRSPQNHAAHSRARAGRLLSKHHPRRSQLGTCRRAFKQTASAY